MRQTAFRNKERWWILGAAVAILCLPGAAVAQDGGNDQAALQDVEDALREARAAREQARVALEAAERVIAAAERLLARARGTPDVAQPAPSPASSSGQPEPPVLPAIHAGLCEDARRILDAVEVFQDSCLGLFRWRDFKSTDLALTLMGSTDSATIDIGPSFTQRSRWRIGDAYRTTYWRLTPGFRAQVDDGKSTATFGDLSQVELTPGVGGFLRWEWGRNRPQSATAQADVVAGALATARRQCMSEHLAAIAAAQQSMAATRHNPGEQACEGSNFQRWLRGANRHDYYKSIVRPLYGYDAIPALFFGLEASFAHNTYKYFSLIDPALTGTPIIPALPTTFPEGRTEQEEDVWSIGGYGGVGLGRSNGWRSLISASLHYRRDFAWASGTRNQQLCAPPGTPAAPPTAYIRCYSRNIGAPYETEGFVAGMRASVQSGPFLFFPSVAADLRVTYSFAEEQWGFRLPLYLLADSSGTPNGGILFACTLEGQTRSGFPLQEDCKASLFLSTAFNIGR